MTTGRGQTGPRPESREPRRSRRRAGWRWPPVAAPGLPGRRCAGRRCSGSTAGESRRAGAGSPGAGTAARHPRSPVTARCGVRRCEPSTTTSRRATRSNRHNRAGSGTAAPAAPARSGRKGHSESRCRASVPRSPPGRGCGLRVRHSATPGVAWPHRAPGPVPRRAEWSARQPSRGVRAACPPSAGPAAGVLAAGKRPPRTFWRSPVHCPRRSAVIEQAVRVVPGGGQAGRVLRQALADTLHHFRRNVR